MYLGLRAVHLDAGRAATIMTISTSTLAPPRQGRPRAPPPSLASAPPVHSARRPTAPLPTALDAFVVLQLAHQQQAFTATSPAAPAPVEVLALTTTVR